MPQDIGRRWGFGECMIGEYDRGTITEPTLLRARREGVPGLRTTTRKDELASSSIPPSVLEFWDLQSRVWRKLT